jgi:hypothetical protein
MTTALTDNLDQLAAEAEGMDADCLTDLPDAHVAERIQELRAGLIDASAALKLIDEWKQRWVLEDFEHIYVDADEDWELRAPIHALLGVFMEINKIEERKEQEQLQS